MKAKIQHGQPGDGEGTWICYLDSGGRGIGPMGFGLSPVEAFDNFMFDLENDIGSFCQYENHSEARRLFNER